MSIFSKNKTVTDILEGVYAKIEELMDHSKTQHDFADNDASEALRLQGQSNVRRNEAVRAAKIADRIRRLIEEE